MVQDHRGLKRAAYAMPLLVFLGVYATTAGHGFIRDDFAWILSSAIHRVSDLARLFQQDNGFYRPVVSLSFALDHWLFGMHPLGYGLTNVAIALACFLAIRRLALSLGLSSGGAYFAASIWLLNLQFIRTGILWISGRTSLLATLFSVLAANAYVRRRPWLAAGWMLLALLSKEEAVLVPAVLLLWSVRHRLALILFPLVEAVYWVARSQTGAATPLSAIGSYKYELTVGRFAQNLPEYLDRSMTLAIIVVLALMLVLGLGSQLRRLARATLDPESRRVLLFCGLWWTLTFAPTFMLPMRSDLYASLPGVAPALVAGLVATRAWQLAGGREHRRALAAAIILVVALAPVHYSRALRRERVADLSDRVLHDLAGLTSTLPDGATVVLDDDIANPRMNATEAFGVELDHAFALHTGRRVHLWIEPALNEDLAVIGEPPCASCVALRLRLVNGQLRSE